MKIAFFGNKLVIIAVFGNKMKYCQKWQSARLYETSSRHLRRDILKTPHLKTRRALIQMSLRHITETSKSVSFEMPIRSF